MSENNKKKVAIIIGAGPAGLTAAYELLMKSDVLPIVIERSEEMGGISQTANYKGNRIDIGGHRFFSRSDKVMDWWLSILPIQNNEDDTLTLTYQNSKRNFKPSAGSSKNYSDEDVMLVRSRRSRIYFLRKFFDYPLTLSFETIRNLGFFRTFLVGLSYMKAMVWKRPENNLEDFFINRFGDRLYKTFFKAYTEKVWGVSCKDISAEWGAQRIKGLSIVSALKHAVKKIFRKNKSDVRQKDTETSLIEKFLYPKYGPGHMWQKVAQKVKEKGGIILTNREVDIINIINGKIASVVANNAETGEKEIFEGDYFFSTMAIKDLIQSMEDVPLNVREVAQGLQYRDFITVGLLVNELKIKEDKNATHVKDNWIYIQEPDVKIGRLQIFNNWSPHLLADPTKVWIGLEYFCYEGDDLWTKTDESMKKFAVEELSRIDILDPNHVLDATVIRMKKTYPAYFGTYDRFSEMRDFLDSIPNIYPVGRNGMHKYNNQDHSMLTSMAAVDLILNGISDKSTLWKINAEQEYHEQK